MCVLPVNASAAIRITDVLYDPDGVDSGREWIHITNTGPDAVSLSGYRLFEGGTNHKLTVTSGTSSLPVGGEAIITTDPAQYKTDHPKFAGAIFKSSFSLSNTGETIELRDSTLHTVDTYSYIAPPVVKAQKAAKTSKKVSSSLPKSANSGTYSGNQAAAVALSDLPSMPALPSVWVYGLGLGAVLLVGAAAALYARPLSKSETYTAAGEFNIE